MDATGAYQPESLKDIVHALAFYVGRLSSFGGVSY